MSLTNWTRVLYRGNRGNRGNHGNRGNRGKTVKNFYQVIPWEHGKKFLPGNTVGTW